MPRRIPMIELKDILERLKMGQSIKEINRELQRHKTVIRKVKRIAEENNWFDPGSLVPSEKEIKKAYESRDATEQGESHLLDNFKAEIKRWMGENYSFVVMHKLINESVPCSESTVRRYVHKNFPQSPTIVMVRETIAGEVMEVDFGYLGLIWDIKTNSSSTIYNILEENGQSKKDRMKMCGFKSPELVKKGDYTSLQHMLEIIQCNFEYEYADPTTIENLTADEFNELVACIRDKPLRYRKKAIVIIAHYEGIPNRIIASCLFISPRSVKRQIHQFQTCGIKEFLSNERKGPKKYELKEYIDTLFSILHSPPSSYDINRTSWIMPDVYRIMASKGLPIALHYISKIIRNAGFKVRKAKVVLTSNDPEYKTKLKEITGILKNLKPSEKFFSIDEYGPCAIKIYNGRKLVLKGEVRTIPHWQKNKGSLIVTAALELSTNQITHFYSKKKNTEEMIKLLRILLKKYHDEECIYFSWDAASWHASKKLYTTVNELNDEVHRSKINTPLVKLAPLPSTAQFLNVIESVFSGMAKAIIHNSNYQSKAECKSAINRYFAERNQAFLENPKRAGDKIWGGERVKPKFSESNNCKNPKYR